MGKTLIQIDKRTGEVVSISKNHDFSNFVPDRSAQIKYVIADDDLPVVQIPTQTIVSSFGAIETGGLAAVGDASLDAAVVPGVGSTVVYVTETTQQSVSVPSYFEQIIHGTPYGKFLPDEIAYQSNITPVTYNHLVLNGATANEYTPTVGVIGLSAGWARGNRAMEFKGTYLDLTGSSAGGLRVPGGYSLENCTYHLVSGHLYLTQAPPSSYEATVFCLCDNLKSGTTKDSYKMVYNSAAQRLKFHWSANGYASSGFQDSVNASPQGITLNQWHHFAVSYYFDGTSASIATYFNGTQVDKVNSTTNGYLRPTSESFCVGADKHGHHPWKGWIDDLIVSGGTTITALRGITFVSGITVPQERQESGDYTVYYLSMDGPVGSSLVPCEILHLVTGVVDVQEPNGTLYVSCIQRDDSGIHGVSFTSGISGGFQVSGVSSASYIFGKNSSSCLIVSGITQNLDFTQEKNQRQNYAELSYRLLLGATTMSGRSGASGDFRNLFSIANWYPTHFNGLTFTHRTTENEINEIQFIRDDIINNGRTASYNIVDASGTAFSFSTAGVKALYNDIMTYHAQASDETSAIKGQIAAASTITDLKSQRGFTSTQLIFKLSDISKENNSVLIKPVFKITNTSVSQELKIGTEIKTPISKG